MACISRFATAILSGETELALGTIRVKDQVYRTPVCDLADLQERIYAAVNNVTPLMLHNTWVEFEYQLDIS